MTRLLPVVERRREPKPLTAVLRLARARRLPGAARHRVAQRKAGEEERRAAQPKAVALARHLVARHQVEQPKAAVVQELAAAPQKPAAAQPQPTPRRQVVAQALLRRAAQQKAAVRQVEP